MSNGKKYISGKSPLHKSLTPYSNRLVCIHFFTYDVVLFRPNFAFCVDVTQR